MMRVVFFLLCALAAVTPRVAFSQSYQQYSDGLISVTAKKVLHQDRPIALDVCAQLMRDENVGPLQVRLNLWGKSGVFVKQLASVLSPERSTPVCQRIALPSDVKNFGRWEIARFQFLREQPPHNRAGRVNNAG